MVANKKVRLGTKVEDTSKILAPAAAQHPSKQSKKVGDGQE